jgi:predicted nucleic acid-binding protein
MRLLRSQMAGASKGPTHSPDYPGCLRYPHDIQLPRIWDLRCNLTAYDVALTEALDAPLLTRDHYLAAATGHQARV